MGTRLFVLANADVTEDKDEDHNPEYPINIKGGAWWTICVPFNMTKAQVDKVFGKGTHVCRFNNVERLKERDGSARYIRLYFQNDVYTNKSTKDENGNYTTEKGVTPADDDIVIYAHESYMIYPKKSSEDANEMYNIKDYQLVTGSPLPTIVNSNENDIIVGDGQTPMEKDDEEEEPNKQYRFIGNYQTSVASTQSATGQNTDAATQELKLVTIPQYSYIFAQKKGDSKPQFWFYVGKDKAWEANKCVVQATAKDGGAKDYETYFLPNEASAKKVYQQSFFGEDNETTGVERVEIIAGAGKDAQIIYNLNGQVVNYNGNMDGLQKGIYIKNGKKYMVK